MIRSHLRSNAVAYLALFFTLGGGVAMAIDRNSVKSKHIKNKTIKPVDVKPNSLTGKQIRDNGIKAADIKLSTVGSPGVVAGSFDQDGHTIAATPGVTADHTGSGNYTVEVPFSIIGSNTPPVAIFQIEGAEQHIVESTINRGSNSWGLQVEFDSGDRPFTFIAVMI